MFTAASGSDGTDALLDTDGNPTDVAQGGNGGQGEVPSGGGGAGFSGGERRQLMFTVTPAGQSIRDSAFPYWPVSSDACIVYLRWRRGRKWRQRRGSIVLLQLGIDVVRIGLFLFLHSRRSKSRRALL